ncbi:SAM-dependent methyltransferase [Sporanaerobium hydrogeniformans]|uniref:SAM-dependent methyltransferase n=1 Tax=Sporanaerobium hydrogeniformans TaxID=3072179 RepID=A0AC61DAP2_9FIRM|nr:class I SAM-dependent methyltransferase [Sporanaerobium hydrogeniformans]PHV69602.1 SAM-dependent methyltransferase [Sporanaerobium hydrogeniformans]
MSNYYNENAKAFFEGTVVADMSSNYTDFLAKLAKGSHILDAGCGSGRDAKNFKDLGYEVTAIDASESMCALASEYMHQPVEQLRFQDIDFKDVFDGIWASASLLHVPSEELPEVLERFYKALKAQGVLYASFKYGDFEGDRNGRYFHDLKEDKAKELFTKAGFHVSKMWITSDVREDRRDEKWLNILCE